MGELKKAIRKGCSPVPLSFERETFWLSFFFFSSFFKTIKATGKSSRSKPLVSREWQRLRGFWGQICKPRVGLSDPSLSMRHPVSAAVARACIYNQFLIHLVLGRKRKYSLIRGLNNPKCILSGNGI